MQTSGFESEQDWQNFQQYLRDQSRFVIPRQWEHFLETLAMTSQKRELILKKGALLSRARIGSSTGVHLRRKRSAIEPLPHAEMLNPPPERAVEGRLNPSGITYLYLADNKETALAEVRPWVGACVSVAIFRTVKELRLIDLTRDFPVRKKNEPRSLENIVWSQINESFSEPASPDDMGPQYVPTQYVTEIFKAQNFDGVRYKSSLYPTGYNYLLFDPKAVKYRSLYAYRVDGVQFKFHAVGKKGVKTKTGDSAVASL